VPIGADELATARTANKTNINSNKEVKGMDEKTRKYLIGRGLAEDATEEEAYAFMETLDVRAEPPEKDPPEKDPVSEVDVEKIREAATGEERERVDEIIALGTEYDCSDLTNPMIRSAVSVVDATLAVAKHTLKKAAESDMKHFHPASIEIDSKDKFRAAATDSLILRDGVTTIEKPAPGAMELRGYSLRELARECLRVAGENPGGDVQTMIGRALTTGDLPLILANVANKSLFEGWNTANETWQQWCGTGQVPDFKTNYMPRVSEFDDLEEIPEHGEYTYGKLTEATESYSIVTYGKLFAVTRQTIINDDLGALTRVPAMHGEAASRKVGDVAYAVLTANAAMGDSVALFASGHSNLVAHGSGAVPGTATIAAGILAMGTQKDLRGLRRLNIRPLFLIAPKALEGNAEIFFNSGAFSDHSTVATDSTFASTRWNPYAGNYFNRVYDARLDDSDAAAWFLAAEKGKTITMFFLNGVQAPYTEQRSGWTVDGTEFKVRIDCGAKAVDWKGLYMNDGN
jgi:hypothetical protein